MQVGLGLALIVLVYVIAQRAGLATAYTLLDRLLASSLLLVVVIFQADIRRALMRVGNRPWLLRWRKDEETTAVEEVISACALLAQRRIGALIVFEREATLDDFVAQGTVLDADVTRELLYTVFLPGYENPLHDGAAIIKSARIWKAGAFLPLTANPTLDRTLGTRHRAALGISEETDAVVVIVSEERGQVSLCFNGNIVRGLDAQSLRQADCYGLFYTKRRAAALLKTMQRDEPKGSARLSIPPPDVRHGHAPDTGRMSTRATEPGLPGRDRAERRGDEQCAQRVWPGEGRARSWGRRRGPGPSKPPQQPEGGLAHGRPATGCSLERARRGADREPTIRN